LFFYNIVENSNHSLVPILPIQDNFINLCEVRNLTICPDTISPFVFCQIVERLCRSFSPYSVENSLFDDTERGLGVRATCCRFLFLKLACESPNHRLNLPSCIAPGDIPASENLTPFAIHRSRSISSQQTGWEKSGSKLHALQSFASDASDAKSTPALANRVRSPDWESGARS